MTAADEFRATGTCQCEALRFTVRGAPRFVAHCHCDTCRRAHGAGLVTFAGYTDETFTWEAGADAAARYAAPNGATRTFCSRCGSTLLYQGPGYPGEVHVAVAALPDDFPFLPKAHSFAELAPPWCPITDDLHRIAPPDSTDS